MSPALRTVLRRVTSLTITDGWWVYGPVPTVAMTFTLHPAANGFGGIGEYRAQGEYGPDLNTTRPIAIPAETIAAFLDTLAASPLGTGAYIPDDKVSDYSPRLRIVLDTPDGEVVFHSESQGERHVPWEARIGDRRYRIDTAQPMDALDLLEPYLRRDETVKGLTASIEATRAAQPTATPAPPALCRTPAPSRGTTPAATARATGTAGPRIAPGTPPRPGDRINLVEYFGLAGSTFLDAGGNFRPFNLTDPQQIAPIIAALDEDRVVALLPAPSGPTGAILFTLDVRGKPVNFGYDLASETVAFGVGAQSYIVPAPANFRALWVQLVCSRPY